jgi:hypothetical protein
MIPSRERLKVVKRSETPRLLEFGLDSNYTDHYMRSPLTLGCLCNGCEAFQELVQNPFRRLLDYFIGRA